jgi:CO/xanthine dehydrogenase Mo-binding subunit
LAYKTIGKSLPRIEGVGKVTGETQYAADLRFDGLLWAKVLRSPIAHGRIVKIDTSKARAVSGVHAIITGADVAGIFVGTRVKDQPVLATDRVRFVGDAVAAIAAESVEVAEHAITLIDVDYEELAFIDDPVEALKPSAPLLHPDRSKYKNAPQLPDGVPSHNLQSYVLWKNGDLDAAFKRAARVFEHSFRTPLSHHGYIEPHTCTVQVHPDGRVEVWASNKGPWGLRDQMAGDFGIPKEMIKVHVIHVGGDFGAKASLIDVPIAYYLSKAAGRPVKLVLGSTEEILAGGHRHPAVVTIRTGVEDSGALAAIKATVHFSGGAYGSQKANPLVTVLGGRRLASMYRVPAIHVETFCAYTNQVPCTQTRTPGSPQIVFAFESQMDIIAREMGIDPIELRRLNILHDGDPSPMGEKWNHILIGEVLERAVNASGWKKRSSAKKNRGWGIALYERGTPEGKASAAITLETDGRINVLTGVPDVGPGFYTITQQMVAETLGVSPDRVGVKFEDTDSLPFDPGTGGSKQTNTSGHAVYKAAREVREKLLVLAARELGCNLEDVEQQGNKLIAPGRKSVTIEAMIKLAVRENGGPVFHLTMYEPKDMPKVTGFAAQVAEVEIEPTTGAINVVNLTTVHDTGTVLNHLTLTGQIEGGIITGLGFALMEENPMVDGKIATLTLGEAKLPCIQDVPPLKTILVESPTGPTPFGGKSIAENPNVPTAAAIANAIADACGVRIFDLPLTAEKVYWGLREK